LAECADIRRTAPIGYRFGRIGRGNNRRQRTVSGGQHRTACVVPGTTAIRVTFSRPMRNGSWSWVKLPDASFPKTTGNPGFLDDQRTCMMPVSLERGRSYAMWLNEPPYENFQDQDGHKAAPYLLVFETRH
jgi:hypothetical protein